MQTCSRCNTQSTDLVTTCPSCGADLTIYSTSAVALKQLQDNPRVKDVRLVVAANACPVCKEAAGTYAKNNVPALPVEGCSDPQGCRCFYEPMLLEIFP